VSVEEVVDDDVLRLRELDTEVDAFWRKRNMR
jgi:hypothetical protein